MNGCMKSGNRSALKNTPDRIHIGSMIRFIRPDTLSTVFTRLATNSPSPPKLNAPIMANFSSRGPNRADANVLKPDVTAPGVDIIAGGTPSSAIAAR